MKRQAVALRAKGHCPARAAPRTKAVRPGGDAHEHQTELSAAGFERGVDELGAGFKLAPATRLNVAGSVPCVLQTALRPSTETVYDADRSGLRVHANATARTHAPYLGSTKMRLQTKLRISEPGDVYEQEADRVAEQVLAKPSCAEVASVLPRIQRYTGHATGKPGALPASVDQVLASFGRPLEAATRLDMEQRFGHDFSCVRVHADAQAAKSAQAMGARAYTVGHDVVFGAGQYDTGGGTVGRKLLAHELTHTIQQSSFLSTTAPQNDRGATATSIKIASRRAFVVARSPDPRLNRIAGLAQTAIEELDDGRNKKVLISTVLNASKLSELPAFAAILRASRDETYGDHFVFLISEMQEGFGSSSTVSILRAFADAGVDITKLNYSLDPLAAVAKFKSLVNRFKALLDRGHMPEDDLRRVRLSIAEAEAALRAVEGVHRPGVQVKQAGGVAMAAGWAWRAAGALAADDLTGIGVADDVAIPFVIIGAAALSAIALFSGGAKPTVLDYRPAQAKIEAALLAISTAIAVAKPRPSPLPFAPTSTQKPKLKSVPDPKPTSTIDVIPLSPTESEADRKRRRLCPPVVLLLPRAKAQDLNAYAALIGQLEHVPNRPRDTNQRTSWKSLTPGRIPATVWFRAAALGLTPDQVVFPFWSQSAIYDRTMEVDHDIEMQVTPIGREAAFDVPAHHRLMDARSNGGAGPELEANIRKMRETLVACTRDQGWMYRRLVFEYVAASTSNNPGIWARDDLIAGRQLDAYERLGRPVPP